MDFSLRHFGAIILLGSFSACTTERVSTEFGALNEALAAANTQVTPLLEPGIEAARQSELTASAKAGDAWFLSEGCRILLKDDVVVPTSSCRLVNLPLGDRPPVQNEATSAQRKLDTLSAYVGALELLMDASSDTAITESYSAALVAFSDLGAAADAKDLIEFIAKRQRANEKEKVDKVVPAVVATLRFNRMRSVVRTSNESVATVVRDLQLHLLNLGVDKGNNKDPRSLAQRISDLNNMNEELLLFDTSDAIGYRAAIVALQSREKEFMDFFQKSAVFKVGLVAEVHTALDKALRNPGNVDNVVGYLETLKSLIETVEG
jgi:hypothetical protein